MIRRNFIKGFSLLGAGGLLSYKAAALSQPVSDKPASEREYWTDMLSRITLPVLEALSQGKLKERMPVEAAPGTLEGRKKVTYLEALGRSLARKRGAFSHALRPRDGRVFSAGHRA